MTAPMTCAFKEMLPLAPMPMVHAEYVSGRRNPNSTRCRDNNVLRKSIF